MNAAGSGGHTPFIRELTGCRCPDSTPAPMPSPRNRKPAPPSAMQSVAPRRSDGAADPAFRQAVLLAVLVAVAAVAAPLRAQPLAGEHQRQQARQYPLIAVVAAGTGLPATAMQPAQPLRERPLGTAQAPGVVHTLRQIPEACIRLEGVFTGQATPPYRMRAVAISPTCQPRARYRPAGQAMPAEASGWILEDRVRVPDATCPSRMAVVQVWRKPGAAAPARDGQGQARIYLQQARQDAAAGAGAALPQFTAHLAMEGKPCP